MALFRYTLGALIAAAFTTAAFAQDAGVPDELLQERRRQQGDSITVCQDAGSPLRAFDREVATAIGDALFLTVRFEEGFRGFPISGDGFLQELRIAMTNRCDLMMGMSVQEESPFPDWVQMTRTYAAFAYVLTVTEPGWQSLGDIPRDRVIGTPLGSVGEWGFITWNQQRPEAERYRRLPYADPDLMLTRLRDGTLGAILVWQPVLAGLGQRQTTADLRQIRSAPLPVSVTRVGGLVSSKDSFLRGQIDGAIDALTADGTIAQIAARHGYILSTD